MELRDLGFVRGADVPDEGDLEPVGPRGPLVEPELETAATTLTTLPEQLRRSITWDRGKEMSKHASLRIETGVGVYFADPKSPWQRGTNENTNGLLRQYFSKGTDLSRWSADDLAAVAHALNSRPRKALGWKIPTEALNEHLRLLHQAGVATAG